MEPRVTMITLGTTDLARAVAFYRDGLGWPMSSMSQHDVAFFKLRNMVLGVWGRDRLAEDARVAPSPAGAFDGVTLAYNVAERPQVDEALTTAQAAGGTIAKPAEDTFWGGYAGYFADPDGHLWEVAWGPMFNYDANGAMLLPD